MPADYQMLRKGVNSLADYQRLQEEFDLAKQSTLLNQQKLQKEIESGVASNDPAAVREWNFYSQLPAEEQKRFLQMKRADQIMNLGGQMAVRAPTGGIMETYDVTPELTETPQYRAAGKAEEEKAKAYQEFVSNQYSSAKSKTDQALKTIKGLRGPEGKGLAPDVRAIVGFRSPLGGAVPFTESKDMPGMPRVVSGSPAASGRAKVQQAKGQVFLEAYESLRGAGALTNQEGAKGEQAKARLDTAQSEKDFEAALDELEEVITSSANRLESKRAEAESYLSGIRQNPAATMDYGNIIPAMDASMLNGALPPARVPMGAPMAPNANRLRYNPATGEFE